MFGKISGAHLNPAVTIGLLVTKNIDLIDSVYYIVAQVIGACIGSLCLYLCLGAPAVTIGGLGATAPGLGVSYLQAMFAEFLGTFFLMMVVMGVAVDKKAEPGFAIHLRDSLVAGMADESFAYMHGNSFWDEMTSSTTEHSATN